jgi:hypothetical protein
VVETRKLMFINIQAEQGNVSSLLSYIGLIQHEEEVELLGYHILDEIFNDDEVNNILIPKNLKQSIKAEPPNWNTGRN